MKEVRSLHTSLVQYSYVVVVFFFETPINQSINHPSPSPINNQSINQSPSSIIDYFKQQARAAKEEQAVLRKGANRLARDVRRRRRSGADHQITNTTQHTHTFHCDLLTRTCTTLSCNTLCDCNTFLPFDHLKQTDG